MHLLCPKCHALRYIYPALALNSMAQALKGAIWDKPYWAGRVIYALAKRVSEMPSDISTGENS